MSLPLKIYLIYLAVINVLSFILYGADKLKAINGTWRVPEKSLLTTSMIGGAFFGYLAMQLFRHKTRHWYFHVVNIAFILVHGAAIVALLIWT